MLGTLLGTCALVGVLVWLLFSSAAQPINPLAIGGVAAFATFIGFAAGWGARMEDGR